MLVLNFVVKNWYLEGMCVYIWICGYMICYDAMVRVVFSFVCVNKQHVVAFICR